MASRDFFPAAQQLVPGMIELFGLFRTGDTVASANVLLERVAGKGFDVRMGSGGAAGGLLYVELDDPYTIMVPAYNGAVADDYDQIVPVWVDAKFFRGATNDDAQFSSILYTERDNDSKNCLTIRYYAAALLTAPGTIPAGAMLMVRLLLANTSVAADPA